MELDPRSRRIDGARLRVVIGSCATAQVRSASRRAKSQGFASIRMLSAVNWITGAKNKVLGQNAVSGLSSSCAGQKLAAVHPMPSSFTR